MLEQLVVSNSQGSILTLSLSFPEVGVAVASIEGLDPVKATLISTSFASMDGGQYQSSRRDPRNLILHLEIQPDWTTEDVKDVREMLYAFFMPKSKVIIQFYDSELGLNSADISGVVESCEAPLFTSEPVVDVSIMCFDPDFVEHIVTEVEEETVSDTSTFTINYDGTVETGFVFSLALNRTETEFTIKSTTGDGTVRTMDFSYSSLVSGDVLEVSTIPGNKYVDLIHSGVRTSLLYSLSRTSKWIDLKPGSNIFNVYATGAAIPFTISYNKRYGGL